jgi:hypothetical protein
LLNIKILGVRHPERYAVRRSVLSAQNELQAQYPDLAVEIAEIKDPGEIGKYALVLILPSLVVNEKLVCRVGLRHRAVPGQKRGPRLVAGGDGQRKLTTEYTRVPAHSAGRAHGEKKIISVVSVLSVVN